jgi:antirestriction protein ArdC
MAVVVDVLEVMNPDKRTILTAAARASEAVAYLKSKGAAP